jgi:hypothetical protein
MIEKTVKVETYAGYKGDERPLRVRFEGHMEEVREVEDRWYSPGVTHFRVVVESGDRYILRHDDVQDVWTLEGFRSAKGPARDARRFH